MDIRCTKCGEPWDIDSLHDYVMDIHSGESGWVYGVDDGRWRYAGKDYETRYFNPALAKFRKEGCVMFGTSHNDSGNKFAGELASVAFDLMGDDVDGVASMLDDAEYLGYI